MVEPASGRQPFVELTITSLTDGMSELEYMAYVHEQLLNGCREMLIKLTAEDLDAIAEEHVGEDISRYPFLY